MSPTNDDAGVTRREFDDRTAEALLAGRPVADEPALSALVAQMRSLTPAEAPGPSAALAELLAHGLPAAQVGAVAARTGPRRRAVSWVVARRAVSWSRPLQVGLGAAVVTVALAGGAAANSLPPVVQTAVADVVEAVTPLTVPRPQQAEPVLPTGDPVPAPSDSPADSDDSEGRSTEPRRSDDDDRGRSDDTEDRDSRRDSSGRDTNDADDADDRDDAKDNEDAGPSPRPSVSERDEDRSGSSGTGRDSSDADNDADRDADRDPVPTPRPEATPEPDDGDRSGSSSRTSGSNSTDATDLDEVDDRS